MKISIISSLYKTENHLNTFLKNSLKLQNKLKKDNIDIEQILIFNNISTNEKEILKNFNMDIFKVLYVNRESIYSSWNRGIQNSNGEYITFWGVDDFRCPKAIIKALRIIKDDEVAYFPFIYKRYIKIFNLNILIKIKTINPINFTKEKFEKGMYAGPHFIAGKKCFDKIGLFDPSFKISGDFEWISKAAKNNIKFIKINQTSGIFRNDGSTLSGSKNKLQGDENKLILEK